MRGLSEEDLTYAFNAIPDKPPVIALTKDPEASGARRRCSSTTRWKTITAWSKRGRIFALKGAQPARPAARGPLFGPPEMPLSLPQARVKNGVGQTTKDLSEHPWAGAEVVDDAHSPATRPTTRAPAPRTSSGCPERPFAKPLARAIVEQRRDLALDADARDRVLIALDALAIAPEQFTPEMGTYLGLRSLYLAAGAGHE